ALTITRVRIISAHLRVRRERAWDTSSSAGQRLGQREPMSTVSTTRRARHAQLFLALFFAAAGGARAGGAPPPLPPHIPPPLLPALPPPPPAAPPPSADSPRRDVPEVKAGGEGKSSSDDKTVSAGPILAGWDNGFFLRSKDENFSLRLTGQLQADYRGYENA